MTIAEATTPRWPHGDVTKPSTCYPRYADQIAAAAKSAFLSGGQLAHLAGIVSILIGAMLVFFLFPKKDDEDRLLAEYHTEDAKSQTPTGAPKAPVAASRRPA